MKPKRKLARSGASPGNYQVMINSISLNGSVITSVEAEPSQVAAGTMVAEEPDIEVAEEVVTEVATVATSCYRVATGNILTEEVA